MSNSNNDVIDLLKDLSIDIKEIRKDNQRFEISIEKLSQKMEFEIQNRLENEEELKEIKIQLNIVKIDKENLLLKTRILEERQRTLEEKAKEAESFQKNFRKNLITIVLGVCGFVGGIFTWALSYFFK